MTVNEYEAKLVLEESKQSDRVVMEAYHHMYHPLMHRIKAIIDSGELGTVKEVQASMQFPWIVSRMMEPDESIHFNLAHGGGSLLEAGCYTVNLARFGCASEPVAIEDAHALGFIKAQVAETNGKAETGIR
jgi:predicted dehydrogenase